MSIERITTTEEGSVEITQALERLLQIGQLLRAVLTEEELAELAAFLNSDSAGSHAPAEKVTVVSLDAEPHSS